ncbi:MAG: class I SAM-dependent methyltransferase [Gammaproteobacteria bacterium]|nr:class I SAM-dependent methyltransferase [Gammaproteobacteria bacterium]
MISITTSDKQLTQQAKELAQHWGFNFSESLQTQDQFFLELTPQHLQLIQSGKHSPGPIYIDFSSGQVAHRRLFGGGKGQTMAKAVGLNKHFDLTILDATAGMGKDAFVFASLGAKVILMERSPISAALLTDALQRASMEDTISDIISRMNFIFGDARKLTTEKQPQIEDEISLDNSIPQLKEEPDVVYLDPMFPHRKKSALVKKEMLAFQSLIGDDKDSDELLSVCLHLAKKRVVVKRPIKAPYLNAQKPSLSMNMKKHRFDIYLKL